MESFNKALNKRLSDLNKLAEDSKDKDSNKVNNKIEKFQEKLENLETTHRKLITSLNEKHSNHDKEIHTKTENINDSIDKLRARINHLEAENHSLKKKIDLVMYTQEKLEEDIRKTKQVKEQKKVVIIKENLSSEKTKETIPEQKKALHSRVPGLSYDDLKKVNLKGNLDEEENVDDEFIDKKIKKSFLDGIYQTWTGKFAKGTKLPEFTITLYGYSFKSSDYAKKHYKTMLTEARRQENHDHEELTMTTGGFVFEKPVNTVLVKNKEFEITKAEAVFHIGKKVYDINVSFINNKMSVSDLKSIVGFLVKK